MKRIRGAVLTPLIPRIEVAPRSGRGLRHVLPLRANHARDLDGTKAVCGARPRSGWSTDVKDAAPWCRSCREQLDTEAEVVAEPVRAAEEVFRAAQVASILRDEIRAGRFLPGHRFLTQVEAEDRFKASNVTVRRAWDILKGQGLIVAEQGYGGGTYVTGEDGTSR